MTNTLTNILKHIKDTVFIAMKEAEKHQFAIKDTGVQKTDRIDKRMNAVIMDTYDNDTVPEL